MIKILLAEDNMRIRNMIAHMLQYAGYEVLQAASLSEIDNFFNDQDPNRPHIDLLIIDKQFEGTDDGLNKIVELRQRGEVFPIILCTATEAQDASIRKSPANKHIAHIIEKPFVYQDFVNAVKSVLAP